MVVVLCALIIVLMQKSFLIPKQRRDKTRDDKNSNPKLYPKERNPKK